MQMIIYRNEEAVIYSYVLVIITTGMPQKYRVGSSQ